MIVLLVYDVFLGFLVVELSAVGLASDLLI